MLEGVPIRWRLALLSAGLTLVILSAFAVVIGQVTSSRVRSDFNNEEAAAVDDLSDRIKFEASADGIVLVRPDLDEYAASNKAVIRILQPSGKLLRRTKDAPNFGILLPRTARVGDLMLNPDTHEVTRGERQIDLTQREFELLEYLMRNERLVISRQKLLDEVWGYDPFSITNTIEVFVSNLRRKLEAGGEPRLLHTVSGAGYVLRV